MSEEPRQLSSGATSFFRWAFPPTFLLGFGTFIAALWLDLIGSTPAPLVAKVAVTTAWLAGSVFGMRWTRRLRHVWLHGDEILVEGRSHPHRFRMNEIRDVSETRFQRVKTITITLGRPSPLGDKVSFVPPGGMFLPFKSHPLVAELRELKRLSAGIGPTERLP